MAELHTDEARIELCATRALYIRKHPDKYTPEVIAWAQGPIAMRNPRRGEPGEPYEILIDPEAVDITHPRFRAELGLPPREDVEAAKRAAALAEGAAVEPIEPIEPDPAPTEAPLEALVVEPAPKLGSRRRPKSGKS